MIPTYLIKEVFYKFFLLYVKMSESAYLTDYQRNQDMILNRAKDYYENDKERLREQARDKYRNLSEEQKKQKNENTGKIDIIICLKKKNETKRISKKLLRGKKVSI